MTEEQAIQEHVLLFKDEALAIIESMDFGPIWKFSKHENYGTLRACMQGAFYCPITALARERLGETFPTHRWPVASMALGLSTGAAALVSKAADNFHGHSPDIRLALLKRLGLEALAR